MAEEMSVEAAASLCRSVATAICSNAAAAADPRDAEQRVQEFTGSLQNLLAAFRRCSAAGITDLAAEAARFQDARACMEHLCNNILHAIAAAAAIDPYADSPASSDTDGRRNPYTPRRDLEELLRAILEWARPLKDVLCARGSLFQLDEDLDKAWALNQKALDDLGQLFGASVHPACTRAQLEQLLRSACTRNFPCTATVATGMCAWLLTRCCCT